MTGTTEDEEIQVDTYLDGLLASRPHRDVAADGVPRELAQTAQLLRVALARFHPSFRFEEELAGRLRAMATGAIRATGAVRFPAPGVALAPVAVGARAVDLGSQLGVEPEPGPPADRGWVLVGGAIASGVSLAAGVLLARRRTRGDGRWERIV
jgi:hypothetical protein